MADRTAPRVVGISIGTELLEGNVLDSNAEHICACLADEGFQVSAWHSVPDETGSIVRALRAAEPGADALILTGGLGPTHDDVTKRAFAAYLGVPLELDRRMYKSYRRTAARRRVPDRLMREQCSFPAGVGRLPNPVGRAPGVFAERRGCRFFLLPGVPVEMRVMLARSVLPMLARAFPRRPRSVHLVVRTVGLGEPEVVKRAGRAFFDCPPARVGIYPQGGQVTLRVAVARAHAAAAIRRRLPALARLRPWTFSYDDRPLEASVIGALILKKHSLAVAESCTGGLLGKRLTDVPDASKAFLGGFLVYSNGVKVRTLLGSGALLARHGAVSAPVARALARAARIRLGSDYALAITGVSGPSGGTARKPVGTVYVSLATERGERVQRCFFSGDRAHIRHLATQRALALLWFELLRRHGDKALLPRLAPGTFIRG